MLQILLLSSVLFAAIAVLYASHRVGHKLFVRTSAGFAVASGAILAGLVWELGQTPAYTDATAIEIIIEDARPLEHGYRLSGTIANNGTVAVSEVTAIVTLLECSPAPCRPVDRQPMHLLIHIPAGGRYPLAHVLDMPRHDVVQPAWQAAIETARVSEAR